MANEISETRTVIITNGNYAETVAYATVLYSMNALEKGEVTIAASTSEADLAVTGVTTPSYIILKNLDSTNTIIWGPKSGGAMVEAGRIGPKGEAKFQLGSSVTIRYKSTAGTPKLFARFWG